jgi:hypothetical protein
VALLLLVLLLSAPAQAQTPAATHKPFRLDFLVLDVPFNTDNGGRAPSMQQSLALGIDFYEASHSLIERVWQGKRWPTGLSIAAWDLFSTGILPLPGGDTWMHEEFHRAVLSRRGINSFNDVYHFDGGGTVTHVSDEDLVRLKREHPSEMIRASAAGIEGDYLLVQGLERNGFFGRSSAWHLPMYAGVKFVSFAYVWSAHLDALDENTDALNAMEGQDISIRDFTGHDVAAWTYDLHRPDEPYEARGVHEGGLGLDRYIKKSDLTSDELAYVTRQGRLQLLNFIDPFLIRPRGFTVTNPLNHRPMQFSARAGHLLAPFGYTIDADVVLQQERIGIAFQFHTYVSQHQKLPGFDISLVEYPLGKGILVSPHLAFWLQPADQRFDARSGRGGGLIGCRFDKGFRNDLTVYANVEAKTDGWVAGNEYLESNASLKIGLTIRIH